MENDDTSEPGARAPAPGGLELVQAFVNTMDVEVEEDALSDPPALASWLTAHGLLEEVSTLTERDLRIAVRVREALRGMALANHDGDLDAGDVETLNRAASDARLTLRFGGDGSASLEPDLPGFDGALARLLAIVFRATVEGTWGRLKACRSDECRWVFYDRSRNHSSSWCSMAVCGNREKARAYRRRRRPGAGA